ncbi:MAG: inositol-3-phosphate synthase [Deltaproteobacteria bacterium]|nr:inositol-3-phosphate synthase [Deltaproteobacteria bacterium]
MFHTSREVPPAGGKLAVLLPGLGAVASTFIAGVELIKGGLARPIGSLTQLGTARMGKRTEHRVVPIRELVPLARLEELVFGAWDIVDENAEQVARRSGVLTRDHVDAVAGALGRVVPRPGVHDPDSVRRIQANHVMMHGTHRARIHQLQQDIRDFKYELGASRAVMIFTASTETYRLEPHFCRDLHALEAALDADDEAITPTMLYAYAALRERVPFINATPNRSVETLAFQELARELGVPVAGRDLKSGQTMMKTVIAPALKARMLGVSGWFSTNILGNRDGAVLDDPEAFRSKEVTKTSVLDSILQPEHFPDLYSNVSHKVAIHYYPPRGDEKEGWDNIDLFGWLGYPMQIKLNFLCRDSILAAPLVLDLALFMDLAHNLGWRGIQEWLSFYFKSPVAQQGLQPEHDLFIQLAKLKNTLRVIAGEEPLTHLGLDYYANDLPL